MCVFGEEEGSAYGRVDDGWAIFGPQPTSSPKLLHKYYQN